MSCPATAPGCDGSEMSRATTRKKGGDIPEPWDTAFGINELAVPRGTVFRAQQGAFTKPWGIKQGRLFLRHDEPPEVTVGLSPQHTRPHPESQVACLLERGEEGGGGTWEPSAHPPHLPSSRHILSVKQGVSP